MNDRFKFRVWDKQLNQYRTPGDIQLGANGKTFIISKELPNLYQDIEDVIVEFCTGLKDKNGNLIYDGDIVVKSDTNALGYKRIRECSVYWHDDWLGWAITTEYGDAYGLWEYTSEHYEIIGNIHEQKDAA